MTLTVVCATMLAAMTCRQLKNEHEASSHASIMETLQSMDQVSTFSSIYNSGACLNSDTTDIKFLFETLSDMAETAVKTSILCSEPSVILFLICKRHV